MDRGQRKKSGKQDDLPLVQAAKEEVLPGYEEYLVLLQERNRLLKRLRKKNKGQIELERKEQGFSLYVNGPHKNGGGAQKNPGGKSNIPTQPKSTSKPKTAGDGGRYANLLDNQALEELTREEMERQRATHAKTAPSARERRRNWNVESVEIKTTRGEKKVKAPEILTGRYMDDFESDENSDELRSSASECSDDDDIPARGKARKPMRKPPPPRESDMFNSSDSINSEDEDLLVSQQMSAVLDQDTDEEELEIDASKFSRKHNSSPKKGQKVTSKGRQASHGSDDEEGGEKLMLSMRELQKLRQSLVKNARIRESLAQGASSGEEDFTPESPIMEVEEDIPTDESGSLDESPIKKLDLKKPSMKPQDTIVLEFGAGDTPGNRRVGKDLSAARKKDADTEFSSVGRRPVSAKQAREPVMLANRSQSAKILTSDPPKKSVRPLSANRRSSGVSSADTDAEASAVMAALQAENQKAARFNKDGEQTPRKQPPVRTSVNKPSRPGVDRSEMPPRGQPARSHADSPTQSRDRPLVSSDKIEQIMERVLKMTPKHQKQLVRMLGKIEKSVLTESTDSLEEKPVTKPRQSINRPVKATRQSVSKKPGSVSSGDKNAIEVQVEILSSWGDAMRLGLTELQLYDANHSLLHIAPSEISVHGAEDCRGTIDMLVNGKFKTNKERNMWTCRYRARRPVQISICARNPDPKSDKEFSLSQMKIWNFNKSITELDTGVKDVRIFVGPDLVYTGTIEKGCGNQVFDYGHVISLKPPSPVVESVESSQPEPVSDKKQIQSKQIRNEQTKGAARKQQSQREIKKSASVETSKNGDRSYPDKSSDRSYQDRSSDRSYQDKSTDRSFQDKSTDRSYQDRSSYESRESLSTPVRASKGRPPASPRGERSPSPSPKFPASLVSPRGVKSSNHRSISPSPSQDRKKTFRSISMSSQSSASSGGESQPNSRPSSGVVTSSEKGIRSETRTMNHPTIHRNHNAGSDSQSESEDYPNDGPGKESTPAKKRGVKTPRKSKRMAARLDGHSDVDSSRSVSDSIENRPPLPQRKSEEKVSRKAMVQKSLDDKTKKSESDHSSSDNKSKKTPGAAAAGAKGGRALPAPPVKQESESELDDTMKGGQTSSSVSVTSSQDDTPMLQKLKDMNKKDQSSQRKKDVPRWLKAEDVSAPFENPPDSRGGSRPPPVKEEPPKPPPTQEEINMLIDEEMSNFPEQKPASTTPQPEASETPGDATPMQRIQKNRSKWRESPNLNLEESWGSLSQFNKCQRGRLSLDMDDDVLDEYINKAAKFAGLPSEPAIEEEGTEVEQQHSMNVDSDEDSFVIPELPYGREFVINICETWGDKHYVGLTGLEIFSSTGDKVTITKIRAEPSDINELDGYNKDPRVVGNLIDNVNRTRDDIHMWLAPFYPGRDHLVYATFDKPCKVSLIRIWNYNKSRIHSYRGAKDVVMKLDSAVIFKGEIARACGGTEGGTEAFGDTILFTMDDAILEAVSQNDEAFEGEMLSDDEPFDVERPSTADSGHDRPFTRAVGNVKQLEREKTAVSPVPAPEYEGDIMVYKGRYLELNFTATWGDHHYLGLTGLEVVGKDGDALPVSLDMITACPQDVRSLPGHERDDRTLDKMIDGTNVTMSDEHMWLIPFNEGQNHTVTIDFGQKVLMAGLRVWNYNKSKEDTYRGARIVHVGIDGRGISTPDGFLVRKGTGNCHFDFAQEISFSPQASTPSAGSSAYGPSSGTDESQNYEVVQMPCGYIYQFQLFSTWGDVYYVGLNGIELYDAQLQKIELTESNISAYPDSVNVLEKVQNDVRTPDKLIDGVHDTMDGGHMWLAPILPSILNRVYVIFDQPTTISMIKVWNYSKTANRGAKDFALLVDDLLVYNGVLQAVSQGARGILPTCEGAQPYHTILFTNKKNVLQKERHTIINNQAGEQDVQMTNDKKIVSHYNDPKKARAGKEVDQKLRPTTSVVHSKKRR